MNIENFESAKAILREINSYKEHLEKLESFISKSGDYGKSFDREWYQTVSFDLFFHDTRIELLANMLPSDILKKYIENMENEISSLTEEFEKL